MIWSVGAMVVEDEEEEVEEEVDVEEEEVEEETEMEEEVLRGKSTKRRVHGKLLTQKNPQEQEPLSGVYLIFLFFDKKQVVGTSVNMEAIGFENMIVTVTAAETNSMFIKMFTFKILTRTVILLLTIPRQMFVGEFATVFQLCK